MAYDLHLSIPEDSPVGQIVGHMVSAERVTVEQAVNRMLTDAAKLQSHGAPAAIGKAMARVRAEHPTYASFFGSVEGPGAHGSREAVDQYIAELRNEW